MLRVCTFGGLTLQEDGNAITGAATHRRQLALLALLAVAGDSGMSREKILAYLWPESDTDSARHALNQLLYMQRRRTNTSSLFLGRKTLRLNPEMLGSDVRVFESAMAGGEPGKAVDAYRGAFLDGFFLDNAEAFEHWVTERREQYASCYLRALQDLAARAEDAGDLDAAAEWLRQATATDPLNSRLVGAHVEALLKLENRAGALLALQTHRDRLWSELNLDPEPSLRALEERLRGHRFPRMA
jgi:DNA-binding SARP family transcriptional activator